MLIVIRGKRSSTEELVRWTISECSQLILSDLMESWMQSSLYGSCLKRMYTVKHNISHCGLTAFMCTIKRPLCWAHKPQRVRKRLHPYALLTPASVHVPLTFVSQFNRSIDSVLLYDFGKFAFLHPMIMWSTLLSFPRPLLLLSTTTELFFVFKICCLRGFKRVAGCSPPYCLFFRIQVMINSHCKFLANQDTALKFHCVAPICFSCSSNRFSNRESLCRWW